MHRRIILINFILLLLFSLSVSAQKLINSPYSRFNLGSLDAQGSFKSKSMGGIGSALRDNNSVFFMNPASYSSLDTNSFNFDFGLDYGISVLKKEEERYTSEDMNFRHLIMGFPLKKGWGVATGIVPVSSGYYKIYQKVTSKDPGYDPMTGSYFSFHTGQGGLSKLFLGSGINLTKNISAGINMNLLFGILERNYFIQFTDVESSFNNNATEKLQISGINLEYGLQYRAKLKNDYFLNIGASLTSGKDYNSRYEQLTFRNSAYSGRDTISYTPNSSASTYIPGNLRAGIAIGRKNKFTTGFDFISCGWSALKTPGIGGYAADTKAYMWGAEYIPDKYSNFSFLKRIEYRIGAHKADNYLIVDGEQVREYGASFGMGIPFRRSFSKTNLFFDFTRRTGSDASKLHTEDFYSMGISLNIYDFWFIKRKYN